jgi:hypothetical protein
MAGYLFTLSDYESYLNCAEIGVYGTILKPPFWYLHHEGTIGDYATMQPGDNVYFFKDRKIYGIGELINIRLDCKFMNFPDAGKPEVPSFNQISNQVLLDNGEISTQERFICTFKPSPHFFVAGVDMDDMLSSNPSAFRNLRVMWKRSFIKIDDEENQAFKDLILKRNQNALQNPTMEYVVPFSNDTHNLISSKNLQKYQISLGIQQILQGISHSSIIPHEMAIEMGFLNQLITHEENTINHFGNWDYLSHQVPASPIKPVDYMDRMDIFGYRYLSGYKPTIQKYLLVEIKKEIAQRKDVDQLLGYVDWINKEYCHNDYSMIEAYLVASDFSDDVIERAKKIGKRIYTIGMRPTLSYEWCNIGLVKYSFCPEMGRIDFANAWHPDLNE